MIGGVPFLHGHEEAAPSGTHLALSLQGQRDPNPVVQHLGWRGIYRQGRTVRRRAPKLNIVGSGYGARWFIKTLCIHERNGSSPVPVAVEECSNDTAVDHARKSLVVIVWNEFHGQAVRCSEGVNLQAMFVGRTAAKTNRGGSIRSLHTEFAHGRMTDDTIHGSSFR